MGKFKVGDKVTVITGDDTFVPCMYDYIGEEGIIEEVCEDGYTNTHECTYTLEGFGEPFRYRFVERVLEKAKFTKYNLKEFDVVEFSNGNKTLVINDIILGELSIGGFDLISWTDDLRDKYTDKYDIMKIYRSTDSIPTDRSKWNDLPVVYERTEVKEMTIEEISEALGYEVKVVK